MARTDARTAALGGRGGAGCFRAEEAGGDHSQLEVTKVKEEVDGNSQIASLEKLVAGRYLPLTQELQKEV